MPAAEDQFSLQALVSALIMHQSTRTEANIVDRGH